MSFIFSDTRLLLLHRQGIIYIHVLSLSSVIGFRWQSGLLLLDDTLKIKRSPRIKASQHSYIRRRFDTGNANDVVALYCKQHAQALIPFNSFEIHA